MDNKIKYAIGGVAVIGIIAYLYNKKKKDDALKMASMATPPSSMETIVDMGGMSDMSPTLLEDSMVVLPDGSIVDGSVIAVATNPSSMSMTDPTRVPSDPNIVATMSSTSSAKFDGGFEYANGLGVDPILGF
jgi:hypothetical protein